MIRFFLIYFISFLQLNLIYSNSSFIELCNCNINSNIIICDGNNINQTENNYFPSLSLLPPVENYFFQNFKHIQSNTFDNMTFLNNHSITITLINITIIDSNVFSTNIIIPNNSKLSINIQYSINPSDIILKSNVFNHIKINQLHFFNIKTFNGRPIFDTNCFGNNLYINKLIFQQIDLTGFSNTELKSTNIKQLSIYECPLLKQLTNRNLPSFLSTTESLEISTTGLEIINSHTFQSWLLILKDFIIRNNTNLKIFPLNIIDGVLMNLNKLDLSYNSINLIDENYNWFPYSYTKYLILKKQQIDLYLKTNILKTLLNLKIIDFSEGFINNQNLIKNSFSNMSNLILFNISYTNLTENMIIDILTQLSYSANQTIKISLLGHRLNDKNFCSYFTIFQKSPNLFHLELDEIHECNCIVDLFYQDKYIQMIKNDSLKQPLCLMNTTRTRCNIQSQLIVSKCSITKPNSNEPGNDDSILSKDAFIGIIVGLAVVLVILLAAGSSITYRVRQKRRMTVLDMEEPVENPLTTIIEERLQSSH